MPHDGLPKKLGSNFQVVNCFGGSERDAVGLSAYFHLRQRTEPRLKETSARGASGRRVARVFAFGDGHAASTTLTNCSITQISLPVEHFLDGLAMPRGRNAQSVELFTCTCIRAVVMPPTRSLSHCLPPLKPLASHGRDQECRHRRSVFTSTSS